MWLHSLTKKKLAKNYAMLHLFREIIVIGRFKNCMISLKVMGILPYWENFPLGRVCYQQGYPI